MMTDTLKIDKVVVHKITAVDFEMRNICARHVSKVLMAEEK